MKPLNLETPISQVLMVGPAYSKRLKRLEIETVRDLLYHFPYRYQDFSLISPIDQVQMGEVVTLKGKIENLKNQYLKWGRKIQTGILKDNTGTINLIWFNQPFLTRTLKKGTRVSLSGKVELKQKKKILVSPEYEIDQGKQLIHTGRLVSIYPETYKVSSKWLRSRIVFLIHQPMNDLKEELPVPILRENNLLGFNKALEQVHFPSNKRWAGRSIKRFAFEELFLLHLKTLKRKREWQNKKTIHVLKVFKKELDAFKAGLHFKLTQDQITSINQILKDLGKTTPMNRLLEGDVSSGKTIVAAMAALNALFNKTQVAFMAPTEILAKQHYQTLNSLFKKSGFKIILLTGSQRKKEKGFDIAIGTHSLIYKRASFKTLSLVIIDEQHRFGVEQRAKLVQKGKFPHILTMTATPIPRTVALSLYGDLKLSFLKKKPEGRKRIKTWVVPDKKRSDAYRWIEKNIKKDKQQAFIVCPLIEESETLSTVKSATEEFNHLKTKVFPKLKLGLIHGRLKEKEKDQILKDFRSEKIDILVATPVVEVGIDIPKATMMVIESAERFGLAQLHQLRGRVGRSDQQSYCLLFSSHQSKRAFARLKAMERLNEGGKLAELDLKLRGPGEIFGNRQHGRFQLKIADFSNLTLIKKTRQAAEKIFPQLKQFPALQARIKKDTMTSIDPN